MTKAATHIIEAVAAPLPYSNLDTDQIMPKQFLRIIDKAGLDRGLLYDLRFDEQGAPRAGFVLNQPAWRGAGILVAGPNFGCGSSREHAVWGLQQFGIRAIIAPGYGEIFYFNALNNGLLLVTLAQSEVDALLQRVADPARNRVAIDAAAGQVCAADGWQAFFTLPERHRRMFAEGQDLVGATLGRLAEIEAFEAGHWRRHPWMRDVAARVRGRLDAEADAAGASPASPGMPIAPGVPSTSGVPSTPGMLSTPGTPNMPGTSITSGTPGTPGTLPAR